MRKHVRRGSKLNNKGMTLIEVLIAMIIVSVVTVPLMYSFVQVARTNAKGRELQQTSVIAQTVMENCKAYNVEDMIQLFDDSDFLTGTYADSCSYNYVEPAAGGNIHHFYIKGIAADNKLYGVHIRLTPMMTQTIDKYDNINSRRDGIFIAQSTEFAEDPSAVPLEITNIEEYEEKLFREYVQGIAQSVNLATAGLVSLTAEEVTESLYEDINNIKLLVARNVFIDATTTTDGDEAVVKYQYTFSLIDDKYEVMLPGDSTYTPVYVAPSSKTIPITIYTNENTKDVTLEAGKTPMQLERIYFFYIPAYKDPITDEKYRFTTKEEICINNNLSDGRELDVYLVKQKKDGVLLGNLQTAETKYDVEVKGTGTGCVNLYHNLKTNIGNPASGTTLWNDSKNSISNKGIMSNQFMEEESKDMMYKVELEVYLNPTLDVPDPSESESAKDTSMSGKKVLTLDGTKINW